MIKKCRRSIMFRWRNEKKNSFGFLFVIGINRKRFYLFFHTLFAFAQCSLSASCEWVIENEIHPTSEIINFISDWNGSRALNIKCTVRLLCVMINLRGRKCCVWKVEQVCQSSFVMFRVNSVSIEFIHLKRYKLCRQLKEFLFSFELTKQNLIFDK